MAAWAALVVVLGLLAAVVGVTTASAQASLGPHVADYEVTTDGEVALDLGPLGALVVDSPLPVHLGLDVVVEEIPRGVTDIGTPDRTLDLLGGDLQRYLQLFAAPQATIDVVTHDLVTDAVRRWLVAWAVLVAAAVFLRLALGRRRRDELAALAGRHRVVGAVLLVVALVGAAVAAGARPEAPQDASSQEASPVFDGTPLEGARITGRLAGVVDLVAGYVTDEIRQNDEFYDEVTDRLERAWAQRSTDDPVVGDVAGPGPSTTATPSAGVPSAAASSAAAPAAASTASPSPSPRDDVRTALVVSDLHCNVGMAEPIGRLAELASVDLVLDAGDTTVNGTSVEQTCVSAVAGALPDDVPVVVADGNHDSATTSSQERDAGWTVLEGDVVEVAGLRVLGAPDPRATRILQGTSSAGGSSAAEVADRLARTACDDGDVDLLLVHDPSVGEPALGTGCVPAQVSGHYHVRTDPEQVGEGIRYISSSTAGATLGQPTVGPLHGTAEMTLLRVDGSTGDVLSWRVVSVTPDQEVTVGPWRAWPAVDAGVDAEPSPSLAPGASDEETSPADVPGRPALPEGGDAVATSAPTADGPDAEAPDAAGSSGEGVDAG
ncbi:metallophosphoesterase [Pseudokineococcus basanitobsidens]|uniref:Metallophosphoesterase n=1 Tax=Pseudokineococcus basanitobsidens TaxID=1926649 RepID=A0ABU8RJD9_9ACTN